MTTQIDQPTFDVTYEDWRPRLYRALVIATDDRDLALDAVDAAFSRQKRAIGRSGGSPPAEALGAARRQLTRRRRDLSGFRLPEEEPGPETVAVVDAVRELELDPRLALIAWRYLGWDDATVGRALGMLPTEAAQRVQVGTARVLAAVGATDPEVIDRALRDAAERTVVPLSRLESVKRDARARRVGVFLGAVAAAAALGTGTLLAASILFDAEGPEAPVAAGPGATLASTSALADLEWTRAVLPFSENGEMQGVSAGDDGYVALLVDYSTGTQAPQAFLSENGLDWEIAGEMPIGQQGGWVSQLLSTDGGWVAVGSAFDPTSGQDRPLVLLSDDGISWTAAEMPIEDQLEVADVIVTVGTNLTSAVVGDDSITVFGTRWGDLEQVMREVIPDDLSTDFGWGAGLGGNIDVYDSSGNVAESFTAEELGLPQEVVALAAGNQIVAYRSTDDGQTWEEVRLPGTVPGWVNSVTGLGETLYAGFGMENGSALYRLDGDEWVRVDVGRGGAGVAVATHGDQVYVAGTTADGAGAVWRSPDGDTWEQLELPTVEGVTLQTLTATPHGLIAVGYPGGVSGPAVVAVDDLTVSISAGGVYMVTDATGTVVAEAFQEDLESADPVEIVDPDSGEVVVAVDRAAIDAAWQQVYAEAEQGFEEQSDFTVVASLDGDAWVRLPLEEVLPPGFSPSHQAVGPGGILLAGWSEQARMPIEGGSGQQIWVGTAG
jgi:hypothetical protein